MSKINEAFDMKSRLRKFADGGGLGPRRAGDPVPGTRGPMPRGDGGGLSKDAVMSAIAARTPAPQPVSAPVGTGVGQLAADPLRNQRAIRDARERAAGLADGGSVPFGSRGVSGLRDMIPQMAAMGFPQQPAAPQPVAAPVPDPTGLRAMIPRVKAMGFADGGSYLDDGYEDNRYQQSALRDGGHVSGPGGRTDDKVGPVMLSDEEYVIPGDTADAIGRDKLDALRLATHDFKDGKKESALRKGMEGGAENLADGGSPWIVDPDGTVRNSASARGTAVANVPPQAPPRGPFQPSFAQPAQVVEAAPKTALTRAGSALRGAAPAGAAIGGLAGAYQSMDDNSTGYRDQFQREMGVQTPIGSVAADTARTLASVGDAATFGVAGRLGRGIADAAGGGSFAKGFMSDDPREAFESQRTERVMTPTEVTPNVAAGRASSLRSDQDTSVPVAPGSYQSRRLSEMGVDLDTQGQRPVVNSNGSTSEFMRTGGTSSYQNLGNFGGNANIYGKASDPTRPGRINDFAGVGPGANASNYASGSGGSFGGGSDRLMQSALRGMGGEGRQPTNLPPGQPVTTYSGQKDRYDKLADEVRSSYSAKGKGNMMKRLTEIEQLRANDMNEQARTKAGLRNNELSNETSRANAQLGAQTNLMEALSRSETARNTLGAQAQQAQLKALQDAKTVAREGEEKGFARYDKAIDGMFTTIDKDGKQTVDKAAQENFKSFIQGSDPKAGEKFSAMAPQDQSALLQKFKTMFDMNNARNTTAQRGGGAVTNRIDMPADVREATWNDMVNNGLPLKDYVWSNLPGTNNKAVIGESGQATLLSDMATTGGSWDNDKLDILSQRTKKPRSSLRSN